MMLVSLAQASAHLRRDTDADDADLEGKIAAASRAVVRYLDGAESAFLNSSGEPDEDSSGDPIGVPDDVVAATLLMVGYLYKVRDDDTDGAFDGDYLPKPVKSLLYPLRTPVFS